MTTKQYDFDVIKLSYCRKHKQHWVMNCPECMAEDAESEALMTVATWLRQNGQVMTINSTMVFNIHAFDIEPLTRGDMAKLKGMVKRIAEK